MSIVTTYHCDNPGCVRSSEKGGYSWLVINTLFIKELPSWVEKRKINVNHEYHFCSKDCFVHWFLSLKPGEYKAPDEPDKTFEVVKQAAKLEMVQPKQERTKLDVYEKKDRRTTKEQIWETELYEKVFSKLENRLKIRGPIKPGDAWKIAGGSYQNFTRIFRHIMETMAEQKRAIWVGMGKWEIIK